MSKQMLYKEEGYLSHNKNKYDINKIFKIAHNKPLKRFHVKDLMWVLEQSPPLEKKRVARANYNIPIIVTKFKNKYLIVDGVHRLQKLINDWNKRKKYAQLHNKKFIGLSKVTIIGKYITNTELETTKILRKNPTDDFFMTKLIFAVTFNRLQDLSQALVYKNIGFAQCSDCLMQFDQCACEGGRRFYMNTLGERIYEPCEDCKMNYCLCDYNIETFQDLLKVILGFVKNFNEEQIVRFYRLALQKRKELIAGDNERKIMYQFEKIPLKSRRKYQKQFLEYLKNINILINSLSPYLPRQ